MERLYRQSAEVGGLELASRELKENKLARQFVVRNAIAAQRLNLVATKAWLESSGIEGLHLSPGARSSVTTAVQLSSPVSVFEREAGALVPEALQVAGAAERARLELELSDALREMEPINEEIRQLTRKRLLDRGVDTPIERFAGDTRYASFRRALQFRLGFSGVALAGGRSCEALFKAL
ncbi:MAG: hypothetical protein IPJ84_06670 [Bdellovibrionales bacterium]|nr:hypothetical protein [Bdellovibrionales bacterium]